MQYVTWEYYCSLYSEVTEEEFDRLCQQAGAKLDVYTHRRVREFEVSYDSETASDYQDQVHIQIQNTVCELINAIHAHDTSGMGSGISSVSNEGYSESYKIVTAADLDRHYTAIVKNGLSGTGLAGAL